MISSCKKVGPKSTIQPQRPLKKSASSEHVARKPKKTAQVVSEDSFAKAKGLKKSKSMKSLKGKGEVKGQSKSKKVKAKVKKSRKENAESISTEGAQFRKAALEYFVYHNTYIPIENSAQRRLVQRIQMIDLQQKSTATSFCPRLSHKGISTNLPSTRQTGIDPLIGSNNINEGECQTEKPFQQIPEKCFLDILTELQFLYLPDQGNFRSLSSKQRLRYSQLFKVAAQKLALNGESLTVEQVQLLICRREGQQLGAIQSYPSRGFPTHLHSIAAYLRNFFCYLESQFSPQLLEGLRAFYGLNYNRKVSRVSKGLPHLSEQRKVVPEEVWLSFQNQMFREYEFEEVAAAEGLHAHNRALFDAFNNQLQSFRPFYSSQGEPFPWSVHLGMTHFDITEQALPLIFLQVAQRIHRQVTNLCGLILDDNTQLSPPAALFYKERQIQTEIKMVHAEVEDWSDSVGVDYDRSRVLMQVGEKMWEYLLRELIQEMEQKGMAGWNDFEFFY